MSECSRQILEKKYTFLDFKLVDVILQLRKLQRQTRFLWCPSSVAAGAKVLEKLSREPAGR
jgi:hypothetical protein